MPAMYAHQRFGDLVYGELPAKIQRRIDPHRDLYNIGLQGPDIFFYADPILWGRVPQYGNQLHGQSGHVFFGKALELYCEACAGGSDPAGAACSGDAAERVSTVDNTGAGGHADAAGSGEAAADAASAERQEATAVYLLGIICHYVLDSNCHAYINAAAAQGVVTHAQIEGDFDRHLIEQEGRNPVKEDLSAGIHPSRGAAAAIEIIYPEADEEDAYRAVRGCVSFQHLVRCPHDFKRNLFYGVLRLIGKYQSLSPHIIRKTPDPDCADAVAHLDELFAGSVPKAVRMISCLDGCLRRGTQPGDFREFLDSPDCDRNFEGVEPS